MEIHLCQVARDDDRGIEAKGAKGAVAGSGFRQLDEVADLPRDHLFARVLLHLLRRAPQRAPPLVFGRALHRVADFVAILGRPVVAADELRQDARVIGEPVAGEQIRLNGVVHRRDKVLTRRFVVARLGHHRVAAHVVEDARCRALLSSPCHVFAPWDYLRPVKKNQPRGPPSLRSASVSLVTL